MRAKLPGTTHGKYFDRDEPSILEVIATSSFAKKVKSGPYEATGSTRRVLKLKPSTLMGKVEAVYEGRLNLAGMQRRLTIYTPAGIAIKDLQSELVPSLDPYGVSIEIQGEEEGMTYHDNGHVSVSRDAKLKACESIHSYIEMTHQLETEIAALRDQLDAVTSQLEEAQAAAIDVLTQFTSQRVQ